MAKVTKEMIEAAYQAEFRHYYPDKKMTELCYVGTPRMVIKKMLEAALQCDSSSDK